ncbi:MAG: PKD domain-containing protein [Sphingobacteriia bacterium]|nr:MAG: PKD domain-containing protein [Sphingobacteriia bacterium]
MKNKANLAAGLVLLLSVLSACKKETEAPVDNTSTTTAANTPIGGLNAVFRDTVTVVQGDVTIRYQKTDICFPSNEIFEFTANAPGFPANTQYTWTFGDGKSMKGKSVRNIYKDPATYTVILEARNAANELLQKASVSVKAAGQQVSPTAVFSSSLQDINILNNMTFTSRSSVPVGTIVDHFWQWGDGTTNNTSNSFIPKNFPPVAEDKTYPVRLVVTANSGCKDTAQVNVFVPAIYTISGSFDAVQYEACTNEYFIFTPNTIGVPAGAVYTWDFADATGFVQGNSVRKSFTYQNDYDVKMTITLKGKEIYKTHKAVRAFGQNIKPKALMLRNIVSSTATTEKWAFYTQSNVPHGFLTGYRWEMPFGVVNDNFNTIVEQEYTKAATPTNYAIRLIVTSNTGCKDSTVANITVAAK